MPSHAPHVLAIPAPIAELDRLGDEIARLCAHLDAATARLLDLIRDFDARGGCRKRRSAWRATRAGC